MDKSGNKKQIGIIKYLQKVCTFRWHQRQPLPKSQTMLTEASFVDWNKSCFEKRNCSHHHVRKHQSKDNYLKKISVVCNFTYTDTYLDVITVSSSLCLLFFHIICCRQIQMWFKSIISMLARFKFLSTTRRFSDVANRTRHTLTNTEQQTLH